MARYGLVYAEKVKESTASDLWKVECTYCRRMLKVRCPHDAVTPFASAVAKGWVVDGGDKENPNGISCPTCHPERKQNLVVTGW